MKHVVLVSCLLFTCAFVQGSDLKKSFTSSAKDRGLNVAAPAFFISKARHKQLRSQYCFTSDVVAGFADNGWLPCNLGNPDRYTADQLGVQEVAWTNVDLEMCAKRPRNSYVSTVLKQVKSQVYELKVNWGSHIVEISRV